MKAKRVGLLIFDGVEVLDFCGPFEVFSIARLDEAQRYDTDSPFELRLVAPQSGAVTATGGMRVLPDCSFGDCPALDVLIVPGGRGVLREMSNSDLLEWTAEQYEHVNVLASVCTGAFLLAAAGLLDGRRATTHWRSLDRLRSSFPSIEVVEDSRVVADGKVLTAGGVTAGIDLALSIVALIHGDEIAQATARQMEYQWSGPA